MNSNREIVVDFSGNDEFLFADGFDGAIIGHCSNGVIYSAPTIIQILQDDDNMTEEEALEAYGVKSIDEINAHFVRRFYKMTKEEEALWYKLEKEIKGKTGLPFEEIIECN